MTSLVRFRTVALLSALAVLLALAGSAAGKPTARRVDSRRESPDRHGRLLRGRRPAAGPRRAVRGPRPAADDVELPQEGSVGDGQRPSDAGAAEHRLRAGTASPPAPGPASTARRTTRSTSTASPSRTGPRPFDAERASGGVDRPGGRARRAQGRPGRVGRRPQRARSRARRSTSARSSPAAAWRRTSSASLATSSSTTRRSSPRSGSSSTIRPGTPGRRRSRAPRRPHATGWTGALPATFSPPKEMRLRVLDFGVDKYGLNAWIFDSTNDGTTNYDKVLFSRTKSAADAVAILAQGRVGRRQGDDPGRRAERAHRRHADQGRGADARSVPRPPLPHLGQSRDRELAVVARRARVHRRLRRVPRPEVPDLHGRGLRRPRGRRRLRGDVRRAGAVLEDRSPADARVRRRRRTTRTCSSPGCRPRTSSSTSSSGSSHRSCRTGRRIRPTTTSTSTASRTAALRHARSSSRRRTRRPMRSSPARAS